MNKRVTTNLLFFAVISMGFLGWAVKSIVSVDAIDKPYPIKADFVSSVGLLPNAEVDFLGVQYGAVKSVERLPGHIRVTMKIDKGKKIPEGSTANLFRKTVLGEQYVQFLPPEGYGGKGPFMEKDGVVPIERTTIPLEFSEFLRSAGRLVSAIPPDSVGTVVHELAIGLAGNAENLRQFAIAGDRLAQTFAEKNAALDRLATNQTALVHIVAQHRNAFGQPLTDLRQVAESLKNARGDTSVLLERGSVLITELANLVASQKANLDCDLKTLEAVIDLTTTPDKLEGLRVTLTVGPQAYDAFVKASSDFDGPGGVGGPVNGYGRWIRTTSITNPSGPPPDFTPDHTLPPVKAVPPCASPLRPVSIDYRPAATTSPADKVPGGTGGAALLVILLAVVSGWVVVREGVGRVRSTRD